MRSWGLHDLYQPIQFLPVLSQSGSTVSIMWISNSPTPHIRDRIETEESYNNTKVFCGIHGFGIWGQCKTPREAALGYGISNLRGRKNDASFWIRILAQSRLCEDTRNCFEKCQQDEYEKRKTKLADHRLIKRLHRADLW